MDVESVYLGIVLAHRSVPSGFDHAQLRDHKVRAVIDALKRGHKDLAAGLIFRDLGLKVPDVGQAAGAVIAAVKEECNGRTLREKVAALKMSEFKTEAELREWLKREFGLVEPIGGQR